MVGSHFTEHIGVRTQYGRLRIISCLILEEIGDYTVLSIIMQWRKIHPVPELAEGGLLIHLL